MTTAGESILLAELDFRLAKDLSPSYYESHLHSESNSFASPSSPPVLEGRPTAEVKGCQTGSAIKGTGSGVVKLA